jgi:hypothetical protein
LVPGSKGDEERWDTYAQSLSWRGDCGFKGDAGKKAFLKPGPTIRSVVGGKVDGSPMWSQCQ